MDHCSNTMIVWWERWSERREEELQPEAARKDEERRRKNKKRPPLGLSYDPFVGSVTERGPHKLIKEVTCVTT